MNIEKLGNKLVEFIQKRKTGISFIEIDRFFEQQAFNYKGEQALSMPKYPNIIYWANWNEHAVDIYLYAIDKLEGKLEMQSCTPLVYAIDGGLPTTPIAKSIRNYKKIHWLPVVMGVVE